MLSDKGEDRRNGQPPNSQIPAFFVEIIIPHDADVVIWFYKTQMKFIFKIFLLTKKIKTIYYGRIFIL